MGFLQINAGSLPVCLVEHPGTPVGIIDKIVKIAIF
jgi:hypothetical protein